MGLRICIDVDDLERALAFYGAAFGLTARRRGGDAFAELEGAGVPIDLLVKAAGSTPVAGAAAVRSYARHWTPVHLDLVVDALEPAIARAVAAGARVEHDIETAKWGRMAVLADPFGHGFCLLELRGRGYDEVLPP